MMTSSNDEAQAMSNRDDLTAMVHTDRERRQGAETPSRSARTNAWIREIMVWL
jgi:hypothetical protein